MGSAFASNRCLGDCKPSYGGQASRRYRISFAAFPAFPAFAAFAAFAAFTAFTALQTPGRKIFSCQSQARILRIECSNIVGSAARIIGGVYVG